MQARGDEIRLCSTFLDGRSIKNEHFAAVIGNTARRYQPTLTAQLRAELDGVLPRVDAQRTRRRPLFSHANNRVLGQVCVDEGLDTGIRGPTLGVRPGCERHCGELSNALGANDVHLTQIIFDGPGAPV